MIRALRTLKLAIVAAVAAGCATFPPADPPLAPEQEAFWAAIGAHCGRAYEGRVAISTGSAGDTAMAGKRLVMHVRECKPGEIRIPGDTRAPGTATSQSFPADAHTVSLNPVYGTNVWTMEVEPARFVYELIRVGTGRRVRVEFDLTRAVPAPPAPWGS